MDAMQYSPLALAFIGDGVYEIRVREKLILEANMPADKLHKLTVERVCAEYQAKAVRKWLDEGLLNEQEMDIPLWGNTAWRQVWNVFSVFYISRGVRNV